VGVAWLQQCHRLCERALRLLPQAQHGVRLVLTTFRRVFCCRRVILTRVRHGLKATWLARRLIVFDQSAALLHRLGPLPATAVLHLLP